MTKKQKQTRVREIERQLLAQIRKRYPRVEHLQTEMRPTGMIAIDLYVPYANSVAVLESVMDRVVSLIEKEGLHIVLIPLGQKPTRRAA